MAADVMETQGTRPSATMLLTWLTRKYLFLAWNGLHLYGGSDVQYCMGMDIINIFFREF